ncbi:MAG: ABC transporter ATP-binding protein [Candidatus Dormibacteraeota bacterium]|nr:ABC transporter ATP-binding protein [Candidatus Dormibacteraeota bacterium]
MAAIELVDLRKYYGKGEQTVKAVDGVSVTIEKGEFVSIVGRSGSGKTTLLDSIGLLMRPTTGTVRIDGEDTTRMKDGDRARYRANRLGFIFQDFNLLDTLNALENVMLPVRYSGADRKVAKARALQLLDEVGLKDRAHHRPTQLSGGEKQRVSIARSLINEPSIVLGDEPTGNLDSDTSARLIAQMRRVNREHGVTFVIVTHDMELASRTDRILRITDGHIVSDEKTDQPRAQAPRAQAPRARTVPA